jgi:3-oxoacyl-[acyl-carrier protein] reductase
MNPKRFEGMTALITGASSGIGAETAVRFGAEGAYVLAHYNSGGDAARRVLERIREAGGDAELLQSDLSCAEGVYRLVDLVRQSGRTVDTLVNNAGSLVKRTRFLDFTDDLWHLVFMLNFHSAYILTRELLPAMIERKRGCVVNVSSIAARNGGGIGATAYASAKAALTAMTKGLAREFGPAGIRVNAVEPGTIDTNYHKNFSTPQVLESIANSTPLGRIGRSEDVAGVIAFLCSEDAAFIQGESIEVNGGFLML